MAKTGTRRGLLAVLVVFASHVAAQSGSPPANPPAKTPADVAALSQLCRIDGGIGGMLVCADGTQREFHIEARPVRAVLSDKREPSKGRAITPGSDEEKTMLAALEGWLAANFTPEQQHELLAKEKLPDPRTQEEDWASQRAELLRSVRYYSEVTRPEVTKVFAGRATVSLSLQLRLGEGAPRQLLWRRFGDDAFARLHLDTDVDAVTFGSRKEGKLLLALANWLSSRLGSTDAPWQAEPPDLADDVRLVLRAYRGYLEATSPRLASLGFVMDGALPTSGTRFVEMWDAQRRLVTVRFDYAANTPTLGRLRDGSARDAPLVEIGSEREAELLRMLDRTAKLRRQGLGEKANEDWQLRALDEELQTYRQRFVNQGQVK